MSVNRQNIALLARQGLTAVAQNPQNTSGVIAQLAADLAAFEAESAELAKPAPPEAAKA